jgi:hypothetical protein
MIASRIDEIVRASPNTQELSRRNNGMTRFGIRLSSASSSIISGSPLSSTSRRSSAPRNGVTRRAVSICGFAKVVALKQLEADVHGNAMVFRCFDFLGEQYLPVLPDDIDQSGKALARAFHKVDLDDIDARQKLEQARAHLRNIIQCEPKAGAPQVVAAPEECLVERHRFEDFEHEALRRQQLDHVGHQHRPVGVHIAGVIAQRSAETHISDESHDDLHGGIGVIRDLGEINRPRAEQQFERVQCSAAVKNWLSPEVDAFRCGRFAVRRRLTVDDGRRKYSCLQLNASLSVIVMSMPIGQAPHLVRLQLRAAEVVMTA